jgi:hypothetical protein
VLTFGGPRASYSRATNAAMAQLGARRSCFYTCRSAMIRAILVSTCKGAGLVSTCKAPAQIVHSLGVRPAPGEAH